MSSTFAFFESLSSGSSFALRFPFVLVEVLGSGVPAAESVAGFFLWRTRPVRSFAVFFASSTRAAASAGDSPKVEPRMPPNGFEPLLGPYNASLTSTGGALSSASYSFRVSEFLLRYDALGDVLGFPSQKSFLVHQQFERW